jgi:hypothetical protein
VQDKELARLLQETNEGVARFRVVDDDVLRWLRKSPMVAELFPPPATPAQQRAKVCAQPRPAAAPLPSPSVHRRQHSPARPL